MGGVWEGGSRVVGILYLLGTNLISAGNQHHIIILCSMLIMYNTCLNRIKDDLDIFSGRDCFPSFFQRTSPLWSIKGTRLKKCLVPSIVTSLRNFLFHISKIVQFLDEDVKSATFKG